jgi:pimeloyl-ACP methyl ester carboxylesterase
MPDPVEVPSTDGVTLAAYDLGGSGRPVLLAHANGFCAAVWAPLAAELAPWHVVAWDARGHGLSSTPGGDMAWEGHGADVLAVMDHFGLESPIGVGHSMGGAALLLAEDARPGTFCGLWLYEPIVFPDGPQGEGSGGNPLHEGALRRRATFADADAAYANFAAKPPLSELCAESLAAYVGHGFDTADDGTVTLRCRPEVEAAGYLMGTRHRGWDALDGIGCPVTVARGAEFGFGPATIAPQQVARLARGTLEDHPELGHFGPLAQPGVVAEAVRRSASAWDGVVDR